MADVKAAKLAAARKKLKDHQEKKSIKPLDGEHFTELQTKKGLSESNNSVEDNPKIQTFIPQSIIEAPNGNNNYQQSEVDVTNETIEPTVQLTHSTRQHDLHLHSQVVNHMRATEILVSEKCNLEAKVISLESSLQQLRDVHSHTMLELDTAREYSTKIEIELRDSKEHMKFLQNEVQTLKDQVEHYKHNEHKIHESKAEIEEKLEETTSALTATRMENCSLHSTLSQLQKELEYSQLRMQLLTNGQTENSERSLGEFDSKTLLQQNNVLENKIARLDQQLKMVLSEKDQLVIQYQQYIQQLNEQIESVISKNRKQEMENESLANREASLIDQISQMEIRIQALQNHIAVVEKVENSNAPVTNTTDELEKLRSQYEANKAQLHSVEVECENTKKKLTESELRIAELNETIETLEREQPDITKLSAANESDKVAAQRATAQNNKLKEELHGLRDAFVAMSNDKLELTEKLQAEKFLNRELTIKLSECEESLKDIKTKLKAKDEEMIRLQENCSQLEKQVLLDSQEIDRLRHYEVTQSTEGNVLEKLEHAEQHILQLKTELIKLRNNVATTDEDLQKNENPDSIINANISQHNKNENTVVTDNNLNIIQTEEAMMKLQERFLRTMKEVAELSDEKQNLEHIILQLQGETETICEYIALYQQQRGILKQREGERVAQMKHLAVERQRMQLQLEELQRMITGELNSPSKGISKFENDKVDKMVNLLSEIKQSHLVDPNKQCSGLQNFHPCQLCSGKLIDV